MNHLILNILASLTRIPEINPVFMDIAKIFVGSTAWVGGLTAFMWYKQKNKKTA